METARNHWRQPRWEVTHPGCPRGWNSWAEHHPLGWTHTWEGRVHDGCHPGGRGGILNGGRRDHPWAGRTLRGSCRDPEGKWFTSLEWPRPGVEHSRTLPRRGSARSPGTAAAPPMPFPGGLHQGWSVPADGPLPPGRGSSGLEGPPPRRGATRRSPSPPGGAQLRLAPTSGVPTRMGATHPTGRRIAGGGELASVSEAADRSGKGYRLDGAGVGLLKYGSIRRFEIALA